MKVYFSGDFSGKAGREPAGEEIPVQKWFRYGGYEWLIPSVYSCGQGVIVDVLRKIPMREVEIFQASWGGRSQSGLSREENALRRAENPMSFPGAFEAVVNGREMEGKGFIGLGWQSMGEGQWEPEEKELADHYGLDPDSAWYCCRTRFIWPEQEKEAIRSLKFIFKTNFCEYPCGCSFDTVSGCRPFDLFFNHPFTGREIRLHVESCVPKRTDEKLFRGGATAGGLQFPEHYLELEYFIEETAFIEPAAEMTDVIRVGDRAFSDSPVMASGRGRKGAAAVEIIGGAQGPASISTDETDKGVDKESGKRREPEKSLAFSSLHFAPPDRVTWYVSTHRKPFDAMPVMLIES